MRENLTVKCAGAKTISECGVRLSVSCANSFTYAVQGYNDRQKEHLS